MEKKEKGLRYNEGKVRYDLIPSFAQEQIAKVFTFGATKYEPRNWQRGMKWSTMLASLKRHIAAFEQCEDVDKESNLLHLAHAGCNIMMLLEYYKIGPEYDDREHKYLTPKKIYIDIDGVLANFSEAFKNKAKTMGLLKDGDDTTQYHWDFNYHLQPVWDSIKEDENFWMNIKPLCGPDFGMEPCGYVTSRSIPEELTKKWLSKNNFPPAPVYCTNGGSKVEVLQKNNCDIFVDDNWENFVELNKAGICTFLMDAEYNRKYDVGYKRIYNLKDIV